MRRLVCCALLALLCALSPAPAQDDPVTDPVAEPDPDLIADLVADLGASEEHLRDEAREALVPLGLHAVPALVAALKGRNPAGRIGAARTLGEMGRVAIAAVPELVAAKESESPGLRLAAARALTRIDPATFDPAPEPEDPLAGAPIEKLVESLAHDDKATRLSAIHHLTRADAPPERIVDALATLLDDRDTDVIHEAVRGIEWHGTQSVHAAGHVVSVLHKPMFRLRVAAYDALARMRAGAIESLLTELSRSHEMRRDDDEVRPWVLGVLWENGADVTPAAIDALGSPDAPMRAAGADALAAIRADDPLVRDALVRALGDPSAVVRRQAATALGALGYGAASIDPLVALMNDAGSRAQADAASALGQIIVDAVRRPPHPSRLPADARKSLDAGLDWIVRHQDADGRWNSDDFGAHDADGDECSGPGQAQNDTGVTALCVLALLHADATGRLTDADADDADARSRAVRRGLRHLLRVQDQDGCFGPRGPANKHWVYGHGISILALCEAWSRTRNPLYRGSIQKALDFTAAARNPESAWRYGFRPGDDDTSVTGWMVAALKTGQRAGLHVDRACFDGALAYLDTVTDKKTGAVRYWTQGPTTAARMNEVGKSHPEHMSDAMTASGLLQRLHLGHTPDTHPFLAKSVERLGNLRPEWSTERGVIDLYFWYPATVALRELGGAPWRKWKVALRTALVGAQNGPRSGCRAGSWEPEDAWKIAGGRVYTTAMAVLCLEVHNDYALPIFRASGSEGRVRKALRALTLVRDDPEARASVRAAAGDALATYDSF